jgi:nondiscriminating glutamyl-tRNA synthetase
MTITRIAPSPTGSLHIGGIRTALFSYALARHSEGKFILRIEDTDQSRFVEGAEEEIEDMLKIYGLNYDEKFKQTERKDIYQKYANELVEKGKAYYCFATKEQIQEARDIADSAGEQFRFRSPFRDMTQEEAVKKIHSGEQYVIRLKIPEGREIVFEDKLQGKMTFRSDEVDDTVLLKSDGFPTYHLAVVIDDQLMGVTHVLRGVEWIPSIPKHVLIYEAFGWEMPYFIHLPLILDPDGGKLSKRKGSVSAKDFIKQGYPPEAVINFLMLLGWSSPIEHEFGEKEREIFSLEEFIQMFDVKDLNKSSAVFNREKLLWFSHQYIKDFDINTLQRRYGEWHAKYSEEKELRLKIAEKGDKYLKEVLELVHDRVKLLSEIDELIKLFYFEPVKVNFSEFKQIKNLKTDQISVILKSVTNELENKLEDLSDWPHEKWEEFMRNLAEENGLGAGKVFMTLRLAITSSPTTPPLYEIMTVLGKKEILTRLSKYVDNI